MIVLPTAAARDAALFICVARRLPGRVTIVTPTGPSADGEWPSHIEREVLPVLGPFRLTSQWMLGLTSLVRRIDPQLVHVHNEPWSFTCRRLLSQPLVVHSAENRIQDAPFLYRVRRVGYGRVLRKARGHVTWGRTGAEAYLRAGRAPGTPTDVISASPPDPGVFSPEALRDHGRGTLHVLFVGRMIPAKGVDDLLRAVAEVRHGTVEVTLVGDGPQRGMYEQLAQALGVRATFTGWLDQLATHEQLASADVLVMPSKDSRLGREQWGRAAVEAMMTGRPVLVSECGELPFLVPDEQWQFPQGDVRTLADRLTRLLEEPELLHAGAERALDLSTRYRPETLATQLLEFWSRCLSAPGAGAAG